MNPSVDSNEETTRRDFVKQGALGAAALVGAASGAFGQAPPAGGELTHSVVAAMGNIFIPSRPGDPGYKDLEPYGITQYAITNPPRPLRAAAGEGQIPPIGGPEVAQAFNNTAKQFFGDKTFLELDVPQQEQYLELIVDGKKIEDPKLRAELKTFYQAIRFRCMDTYYKNYPEHEVKRNAQGEPILKPGDLHQITGPNTKKIYTGWDLAGFNVPLDWEQEEKAREKMKKILPHWTEADLVKRNAVQAAPAIKTGEGKDYYDVLVLGGGTAGCIVAGRLAERGINPKTGDRLRVAMIEGGDDWTVRDPGYRSGYGYPIRRRMITNVANESVGIEGELPAKRYTWPWEGPDNLRVVGGMSNHYGGNVSLPEDDDFNLYRQASGVNWDVGQWADAMEEIREMFHVTVTPAELLSPADHYFAHAVRALGFPVYANPVARRNCLSDADCGSGPGLFCRYDAKGNSLPWAYIGMNNGLKIIANAEVDRVLIEKPAGGRPVAVGAVYQDRSGAMHEVRAARVIVACASIGTPLVMYRSGYGPREFLGDNLIVENKNVGYHLSGDGMGAGGGAVCYFEEPVFQEGRGAWPGFWAAAKPRPWPTDLAITFGGGAQVPAPHDACFGPFAAEFGWAHKEYMRNLQGRKHVMNIGAGIRGVPWSWKVTPDHKLERVELDVKRIEAARKECVEWSRALYDKLPVKPIKTNFGGGRGGGRPPESFRPVHHTGTARAGESRETSVCTSDFDCHDIDHLLFTSGASIPRTTFSGGMGPIASGAAYAWRRMIVNHFSRGCSTKGFA